ncbi:hypothetical protein [Janthinobacterium sp. FW305-129]|uniref:hypothetical protein n=1 Tax=Janthinobacterium sp. FW305-129 TaxID=2775054 RepID=UPI001E53D53A|nr:hypothetical protein [Janthinobacterium sp. FW305-129]
MLEPGNPDLVFGKTPDGGSLIDSAWRDNGALQADGQPGTRHTTGWSLARNRPISAFTA